MTPPTSSAFWYEGVALSNEALPGERDESRLLMVAGTVPLKDQTKVNALVEKSNTFAN